MNYFGYPCYNYNNYLNNNAFTRAGSYILRARNQAGYAIWAKAYWEIPGQGWEDRSSGSFSSPWHTDFFVPPEARNVNLEIYMLGGGMVCKRTWQNGINKDITIDAIGTTTTANCTYAT